MTTISYSYSKSELGWVSDVVKITGFTQFLVKLSTKGRVAILKANEEDGIYHKVEVSPIAGPKFEYNVGGVCADKYIKIITSEEPEYIKYE